MQTHSHTHARLIAVTVRFGSLIADPPDPNPGTLLICGVESLSVTRLYGMLPLLELALLHYARTIVFPPPLAFGLESASPHLHPLPIHSSTGMRGLAIRAIPLSHILLFSLLTCFTRASCPAHVKLVLGFERRPGVAFIYGLALVCADTAPVDISSTSPCIVARHVTLLYLGLARTYRPKRQHLLFIRFHQLALVTFPFFVSTAPCPIGVYPGQNRLNYLRLSE